MIRTLSAKTALALLLAACGQPEVTAPATAPEPPASTAPMIPVLDADADALTAAGFGPLRIGMSRAEVVAALGEDSDPDAIGGIEPESCDQWRPTRAPDGVLVMIQDDILTRVSVASPSTLKTDRGFGVGDAAVAIKAAYGPLAVSSPHPYSPAPAEDIIVWTTGAPATPNTYVRDTDSRGVRYEIDTAGRVRIIHVGGPAIQLVEGCL